MSTNLESSHSSPPHLRTRSCGNAQTVEITRQLNSPGQQTGPIQQDGERRVSQQPQRATDYSDDGLGTDEDGYLSMRAAQILLTSSVERDNEYVPVVHQQLALSDDDERGGPDVYEEVRTTQQRSFFDRDEYVPMMAQRRLSSSISSDSPDEYEPVQFVNENIQREFLVMRIFSRLAPRTVTLSIYNAQQIKFILFV